MPKDKNLINKIMGTQTMAEDEQDLDQEEDTEQEQGATPAAGSSEDWLSEYEGQLTIDMYQTKDNVIIKSTIAGVRPEDIDVTIANDMVTIRGERKRDFDASSEDYFYQECYWGSFSRSVVLPVDVDIENVTADLKDGILTVMLPKAAKAKAKKVRVGARV
jgi:HSP20 family protein